MVGRDLHPKEPWNTFPQVHPSPQHTLESARARAAADRRGKQSEGTQ